MTNLTRYLVALLSGVSLLVLFSARAGAANVPHSGFLCTVNTVSFNGGALLIKCTNNLVLANGSSVPAQLAAYSGSKTCATPTNTTVITHPVDDLKMFQAFATSGLLAGKGVWIDWEESCPGNTPGWYPVYLVGLNNQ